MAVKVVRYRDGQGARWGVAEAGGIRPLSENFATTGELLRAGRGVLTGPSGGPLLNESELDLLSPITQNQQLICQVANYRSHAREAGLNPGAGPNVFFRKASSSLCGPHSDVVRPARVRLLDYEIELGLVIGSAVTAPLGPAPALSDVLAGLVVINDMSARDVQVPEEQYFKGKSFRTFCPAGPYLVLLDPAEFVRIAQLRLSLSVNGEVRQDGLAADMIYGPAPTLGELSEVMDLHPGDVIATGTPAGVALRAPGQPMRWIGQSLPASLRWPLFIKGQLKSRRYLQPGDLIEASIREDAGDLDLGVQRNRIVAATGC